MRDREFRQRAKRINNNSWIGIMLLVVGGAFLARQLGVDFPKWFFSWEMLLIAIGVILGFKSKFRDFGWLIPIGIGFVFLTDDIYPVRNYAWPVAIIIVGLIIILRPQRKKNTEEIDVPPASIPIETSASPGTNADTSYGTTAPEILDITSIFGGSKRVVVSKNFRGGEVVSVFGGADINLMQADFNQAIRIEIVAIFGGCTLIVPANWEIRSETAVIMGAIDDKRNSAVTTNPEKVLILEGTVIFGGIEIKSF